MENTREVKVRYHGELEYRVMRCKWSTKASEDIKKHHNFNMSTEWMDTIVQLAGDQRREDHNFLGDVRFELIIAGAYRGKFISHCDGTHTYVVGEAVSESWDFKSDAEPMATSDFWYDLAEGGYININQFLASAAQREKVFAAVETLVSLRKALMDNGLMEDQ